VDTTTHKVGTAHRSSLLLARANQHLASWGRGDRKDNTGAVGDAVLASPATTTPPLEVQQRSGD